MRIPFVELESEYLTLEKEYEKVFKSVMKSGKYILGENLQIFENRVKSFTNTSFALGVGNGSDALFLGMKSIGIKSGDEVIVPANTFIATAWAVKAIGATPILCDVNQKLTLDVDKLVSKISSKTKAVISVHWAGVPADLNSLGKFCTENQIFLIEDAAQAFGSRYENRHVGSFGSFGAFSLHPLKNLSTMGDGGILITNKESIFREVSLLRNHGLINRDQVVTWGYNSRLDELQAAIANIKLNYFQEKMQRIERLGVYLRDKLERYYELQEVYPNCKVVWHRFILFSKKRDQVRSYLIKTGIETSVHYPVPLPLQKCFEEYKYNIDDFPITKKQSNESFSIPFRDNLTDNQIEFLVDKLIKAS